MKSKLLLELEEKHEFPNGKEKSLEFFRNFSLFSFSTFFDGNNPHYSVSFLFKMQNLPEVN